MTDWSDIEECYQDMRAEDPTFSRRLQKANDRTVPENSSGTCMSVWELCLIVTLQYQALEEESSAEKRQLLAMHQQRVISRYLTRFLNFPFKRHLRINQRKKEAMQCYTNSLNKSPPNTHRVQKCLQKLLRSMHKDRLVE